MDSRLTQSGDDCFIGLIYLPAVAQICGTPLLQDHLDMHRYNLALGSGRGPVEAQSSGIRLRVATHEAVSTHFEWTERCYLSVVRTKERLLATTARHSIPNCSLFRRMKTRGCTCSPWSVFLLPEKCVWGQLITQGRISKERRNSSTKLGCVHLALTDVCDTFNGHFTYYDNYFPKPSLVLRKATPLSGMQLDS